MALLLITILELSEDYSLEKISIQVPNDEKPPRKITLNERFTVL